MRCALLQINTIVGDIAGNFRRIAEAYATVCADGIQLCVTPELALVGYPPRDLLLYLTFLEEAEKFLHELTCRTVGQTCALVIGTIGRNREKTGKLLYNQAIGLLNGKIVFSYNKCLLSTDDVFDEARYFQAGDTPCLWEYEGKRFVFTISKDIWDDSADSVSCISSAPTPVPSIFLEPFDILVNLSASPFAIGKQLQRETAFSSIALTHGVHVLYINSVGGNDEQVFDGRSMHMGSNGRLLASAEGFTEEILQVSVNCESSEKYEYTTLNSDDFTPESEIWRALALGTRDYCFKIGYSGVVLGLSGGIDSALTAAIACAALGSANVHALLMPSQYSSSHSYIDALALAKNLGIKTTTLSIEEIMQAYDTVLSNVFQGQSKDVTEENLQARIRGNLLMAFSNKFGKILLTTGNKSEISVGYCTIYGDMCGALAVIGDLYKTQVYRLAHWFNTHYGGIPENILLKAPSAELRPGQIDQDSLPPYEKLDAILYYLIEEHLSVDALINRGYSGTMVDKIVRMMHASEFKRWQAAPVIKITRQALGRGRRMPLACSILPQGPSSSLFQG